MAEAYSIDTDYYRLMWVSWWGDEDDPLPAGFTSCRIDQQSADGDCVVTVLEDHGAKEFVEYSYVVPADTLVLAFYGPLPEEDNQY